MTGPTAAVMPLNADQVPIAAPRSVSGKVALSSARLPGTNNAAPIPCTERAAISWPTVLDSPHSTEAAVKRPTPIMKMRRRPKRSPSAPPTSSSEARNSA